MGYHLYGVVPAERLAALGEGRAIPAGDGGAHPLPQRPLEGLGDPPAPVQAVVEEDLAALVSPLPAPITVPRPRQLTQHYDLLLRMVEGGPVLPFRFGLFVDELDQVRLLLRENGRALRAEFQRLGNAVEASVVVFWSREEALAWLRAQPAARASLERLGDARGARRERLLKPLGQRVAELVDRWRDQVRSPLAERLGSVAREVRFLEPRAARVLLNVACLVARERIPRLKAAVEQFDRESPLALTFRVRAPLPPFTFSHLVLRPSTGGAAGA